MRKVKMFCHGDFEVFEEKINAFLEGIHIQRRVEIQYATGAIDGDFYFTALIFYDD